MTLNWAAVGDAAKAIVAVCGLLAAAMGWIGSCANSEEIVEVREDLGSRDAALSALNIRIDSLVVVVARHGNKLAKFKVVNVGGVTVSGKRSGIPARAWAAARRVLWPFGKRA